MSKYIKPTFRQDAFHCPYCHAFSKMDWSHVTRGCCDKTNQYTHLYIAGCQHCKKYSIWERCDLDTQQFYPEGKMLYPFSTSISPASGDMPLNIKEDYNEAASIITFSPRGAAALLRLALQKLCQHLGSTEKDLDKAIKSLSDKGILSPNTAEAADTMRITGNNAVHPGEMDEQDRDEIAYGMFELLNFIVEETITFPNKRKALFNKTPEAARKAAERRNNTPKKVNP